MNKITTADKSSLYLSFCFNVFKKLDLFSDISLFLCCLLKFNNKSVITFVDNAASLYLLDLFKRQI